MVGRNIEQTPDQYQTLFDQNPQPMWVFDSETLAFFAVNQAARRQYGYSPGDLAALPLDDIGANGSLTPPILSAREAPLFRAIWRHRMEDDTTLRVEVRAIPVQWGERSACLVLVDDVQDRMRLEEELRQAHKMEAVGLLAGGVAHDFNNMLTAILGYGGLLAEQIEADTPIGRDLREIIAAAERAAGLTRQLLAFSRKQVLAVVALDLNHTVRNVEPMLRRLIGERITIKTVLAGDLHPVLADASQLDQVLMNLSVNARDAMPKGGVLMIETRNATIDESYASVHPGAKPGSYAMLSVTDTGTGMTPELQARVFEPFFTTKERDHGTGLGLAAVYGIVKQLDGYISVESAPGRGSSFKIYLARTNRKAELRPAPAATGAPPTGTETILLVEDESSVREFAKAALERHGYRVVEADSAEAALAALERSHTAVHLLLTDMVLPRMDGRELAARVTRRQPHTQVLFMSGYADRQGSAVRLLGPGVQLLNKPFTANALLMKTRQLLDGLGA